MLKKKSIDDYDGVAVKAAFDQQTGTPTLIAPPHEEAEKEADFRLRVSEDGLTCEMWYIPEAGGASHPSLEAVKGLMNARSVVFGHEEDAIKRMLDEPVLRQWVVTAKGAQPLNGKDAVIDYKVDLNILKPRTVGDHVDMKELGAVINVVQGQEIAEKRMAVQGQDGMTLAGKKISAYVGKDKNLPVGKGTLISEDKLHLYAEFDGNLFIKDGKLCVNPVFEVKGDVDYSVGNIDFIGPVSILGAVREGFEVHSGSDIEIDGVVEGAVVEAKGNLSIRVGVGGNGKAKLAAQGDVEAGYIDQSYIRAGGNIKVSDAIRHSDVGARGEITALGKKGLIVGGRIQAGVEVNCDVLGSEMGTKTEVFVGELPELAEERKRNEENLVQMEEQLQKINANMAFLKDLQQKGTLPQDKQEMLAKVTKAKFQMKAQFDSTKKRLEELEAEREKNKQDGMVRVKGICYPGVTISMRGLRYPVRENLKFTRFVYEDGAIKIKPYEY